MKHKYKPLSVVWETTLQCNMQCIHCGSSAGKKRINELSTKEGIQLCSELQELGTKLITLMGGEPFLRHDWTTLAHHIRDLGMNLTLMSNGYSIGDKIIKELQKLDPYAVTISIDGGTAQTHNKIRRVQDSFEHCLNTLDLLTDANIPTTVITTLNKYNFHELPLLQDILINRGIAWQIQMATPIGRFLKELMLTKEEFYSVALYIAHLKQNYSSIELPVLGAHNFGYHSSILPNLMLLPWIGCQAGLSAMGIKSDGGIIGCLSLPESFLEGNIRNETLENLWKDPNNFSYNRQFKQDDLNGACKECSKGKRCKGGCLTVSKTLTDTNHNNPYCLRNIEQEFFKKERKLLLTRLPKLLQ